MPSRQAELLRLHREEILALAARHGACNIRVFGSVARGEEREDSDVDLLIDYDENFDMLDLIEFWDDVQKILGHKVDVITENGLLHKGVPVPVETRPL
jgi:predicted nucleotidyltransferase